MPYKPHLRVVEPAGATEIRIETRRIPAAGGAPALELVEARPNGQASGAPLLFLHGGFGGAWMWNEIYLPFFATRGRHAAAVSLRAHGASGGYDGLRRWSLQDFAEDVRRAHAALPAAPLAIGHSMGGLLAQIDRESVVEGKSV